MFQLLACVLLGWHGASAFKAGADKGAKVVLKEASQLAVTSVLEAASGIERAWQTSYAAPTQPVTEKHHLKTQLPNKTSEGWMQGVLVQTSTAQVVEPAPIAAASTSWECVHYHHGQGNAWCQRTRFENGYEYQFNGGVDSQCGGCYCCRRQEGSLSVMREASNMFQSVVHKALRLTIRRAEPSVAFLVLGYAEDKRPAWSTPEDSIVMWSAPQNCSSCPNSSQKGPAARLTYPLGWWCAQRHYWDGVAQLMSEHPDKDYYFLADADTLVFPQTLGTMMRLLDDEVLATDEDLYMGDVNCYLEPCQGTSCHCKNPFVASGGGVLLRGQTMRKMTYSGQLETCTRKAFSDWCWHHLDWTVNECMNEMGVYPRFHHSFKQFSGSARCSKDAVACHPVKTKRERKHVWTRHSSFITSRLDAEWATPLHGTRYTGEIGPPVFHPVPTETQEQDEKKRKEKDQTDHKTQTQTHEVASKDREVAKVEAALQEAGIKVGEKTK